MLSIYFLQTPIISGQNIAGGVSLSPIYIRVSVLSVSHGQLNGSFKDFYIIKLIVIVSKAMAGSRISHGGIDPVGGHRDPTR